METVKRARKPRQPKADKPKRTPKPKVEKPKRTPKPKVEKPKKETPKDKLQKKFKEYNSLSEKDLLHQLFKEDLDIVKRETVKKMAKIMNNSNLSEVEKKKKTDRLINNTKNFLMKHAETYEKDPEFHKQVYLEKQRNFGNM